MLVDRLCTFKTIKNVYWDNWGRYVLAFPKDGIFGGIAHFNDEGKVEDVTATSPLHDVSDFVDMDCIEILEIQDLVQVQTLSQ